MIKTDIYLVPAKGAPKIVCILGWDEEKKKIVILKGKRIGEDILKDRFLDKRAYPEIKHIEASQGEYFIRNLTFGLTGTYEYAGRPYEED